MSAQTYRLAKGGRIDRSRPIRFTFNGRGYEGYEGDTLASALLANGVLFVARSFKYHRPRGIVTAGVDEPNAVVQLEEGPYTTPNARATEIALYEGLVARSVNAEPDLENDRLAINQKIARFIPAGFYYKTFMWPRKFWPRYEKAIREAAGLGRAPEHHDPDRYDKCHAYCDVLIVGGGPAGLAAALEAGRSGLRVMVVDDQAEFGGSALSHPFDIDSRAALGWVSDAVAELHAMPEVTLLTRSTAFGYQSDNLVTVTQRLSEHLPLAARRASVISRELLWKIRAKRVILATGTHERPLVFGNNDLPGIMQASALSSYVNRYAVLPGKRVVVFANNDAGDRCAIDLAGAGASVTLVDPRTVGSARLDRLQKAGVTVKSNVVIRAALGSKRVETVELVSYRSTKQSDGSHASGTFGTDVTRLTCDLVAMSGGWSPVIHLFAQSGGKAVWDDQHACFVPGTPVQAQASVGGSKGNGDWNDALQQGAEAGAAAVRACGLVAAPSIVPRANDPLQTGLGDPILPMWLVGKREDVSRAPKQFVDLQNDVAAADILLAVREGFESVEHVKRYTAMGFGTDQGKLGNINGMGILAEALGRTIPETGTTTYRPNYTPVSFGTFSGRELGEWHDPVRKTCIHEWHVAQGAMFEDVGQWKRPWYYPRNGEDLHAAVKRECLAVRQGVGILDASTLGKIDIQGPDAVTLLNWVYTNPWNKLEMGKCRYGLMLDENGMIFDDGVTARLGEHHFMMTTTTGGAARVMTWLERWHQTEWPDLRVRMTSVTDHWATFAVVGPHSRRVVQSVCDDIDFSNAAFPFMGCRTGTVAGVAARVMRISFSGELAFEVNVPANVGQAVWDALMQAGAPFDITPYGTETMHVLRAEKGYIIVGQDTDGSMTPHDVGMGGMVAKSKDFLGARSLKRADTTKAGRKQLVGLLSAYPSHVLPEGAQIILPEDGQRTIREGHDIVPMIGHVTSSYFSAALGRSIALAVIKGGASKIGSDVTVATAGGGRMGARIASPVFYDAEGARQHVE